MADIAAAPGHELKRGVLSVWEAVGLAVAVLSPAMAMAYNTSFAASAAGGSTPLAFLLGGVACLALAFVVIGFARRMAAAGYAYTYTARSLGQNAGFLVGWLYFFGFFCFVPMTMAGVGGFTRDLIQAELWHGIPSWSWFVIFLIGMAVLLYLVINDIKISARTTLWIGAATVAVFVVLDLILIVKGGAAGNTLAPFTFSHTLKGGFNGVFFGIIYGVLSYIGFETCADFGEETANPRRAIPFAVLTAVIFAIVFYVGTTYAYAIGIGVGHGAQWAGDPTVASTLATRFAGSALSILISIAAILSAFVVCVACAAAGTRTLFAMGREGVIPRWFGYTHPVHKTPANAAFVVSALATVVAVLVGFGWSYGAGPYTVFGLMAGIGGLSIIIVYVVLCIGSAAWFRRTQSDYKLAIHGVIPVIGAVIFALGIYGSIYPVPPMPGRIIPYVNLGWIIAGLLALAYVRRRYPGRVAEIGSVLGEEGGEEAAVLDAAAVPGQSAT